MVERKMKLSGEWWWFESQRRSISRRSPWLQSTLAELDEKIEAMVKLIEDDADSFAKRAEMYYKKRPELINIIEHLYHAHRSLAERFDQVKFDSAGQLLTPWTPCPLPLSKDQTTHLTKYVEKSYDSFSDSFDFDHDDESNVNGFDFEEAMKLKEEIERLKEENKLQKELLIQKDEEKREAIRQLSFSVDLLKDENVNLKKVISKDFAKKHSSSPFDFNKLTSGVFWGNLFNGLGCSSVDSLIHNTL